MPLLPVFRPVCDLFEEVGNRYELHIKTYTEDLCGVVEISDMV